MAGIDRRKFMSKLKGSPMAYIGLIILTGLFTYSAIGAYNKSRLAEAKLREARGELSDLQDQKERLSAELENANTPFGQEKAFREKFNVVKEGERVIMIVDQKESESASAEVKEKGFWAKIFGKN